MHSQITRKLGLEVLSGELPDGAVTSELALCRRLHVSRTILRESIKVLVSKGLLEVRPKVGVRVRPRQNWNLFDPDVLAWQSEGIVDEQFVRALCEVRLIVETAAAVQAATRATSEERALIGECGRKMELNVGGKAAHPNVDIAFHGAIFVACHNELLKQIGETIRAALRLQDRSGSESEAEIYESMVLHKDVADAIFQGNAAVARTSMRNVILHVGRRFYRLFHPNSPDEWDFLSYADHATLAELRTTRHLLNEVLEALNQRAALSHSEPGERVAGGEHPLWEPT